MSDTSSTDAGAVADRILAEVARRRTLAEAATPGPWAAGDIRYGDFGWYSPGSPMGETEDSEQGKADARFSSSQDPAHVLAVLADVEARVASLLRALGRAEEQIAAHAPYFGDKERGCRLDTFGRMQIVTQPWPCPDARRATEARDDALADLTRLAGAYGAVTA